MNKWKRATCGLLAVLMTSTMFTGCGKEEPIPVDNKVVSLPPEEQILTDSYEKNPVITEFMTYTENVASYTYDPGGYNERTEAAYWKLFQAHEVQIDCMDLIQIGESTMGEVVENVNQANKAAIDYAIESVRAARQEILDAEYDEEKRKAEKKAQDKGIVDFDFTINYPRPQADVSDLSYENPYTYYLAYNNPDNQTSYQYPYIFDAYQGKKLIDPSVDTELHLFIYKYDVPYVQCTFKSVAGTSTTGSGTWVKLYNNYIDQEQDWTLTAIAPADCTFLVDQELVTTPEYSLPSYVDTDWRSKGAKNNMITNGNIKFGGEGFTWDSLMTLCHQLGLSMNEYDPTTYKANTLVTHYLASTYEQTSDAAFTYYTIYLPVNKFFRQKHGELVMPISTITVTFDKLTNNCVNWKIDYGQWYHCFLSDTKHSTGNELMVDVRNYKIDTSDYEGMLATVDNWVKQNQTMADFGYYLVNSTGVVVGKIDEGLKNYQTEISVGGVKYYCVKPPASLSDMKAHYLSEEELAKLKSENMSDEEVAEAGKLYYIMCMAVTLDEKGKAFPLGYFNNTGTLVDANKKPSGYYIHSVEYDNATGYKNAVIIDKAVFQNLMAMYVRTFKMSNKVQENLGILYQEGDPWKMFQYMTQYVQANVEERERIENEIGHTVDNITKNPLYVVKQGSLNIVDVQE